MRLKLKAELSQPMIWTVIAIVVVLVALFGWRTLQTPKDDGRAIVDAAARYQAAHGIDIKTVPTWSAMWYRYHPEYKGPHPPVRMPQVNVQPPPGASALAGPASSPSALPVPPPRAR